MPGRYSQSVRLLFLIRPNRRPELRLIEQGFIVQTARTAEQALSILARGETDLVVSELDLAPNDGLALLAEARKAAWGKELPWVIYTRLQERALAQKAFGTEPTEVEDVE